MWVKATSENLFKGSRVRTLSGGFGVDILDKNEREVDVPALSEGTVITFIYEVQTQRKRDVHIHVHVGDALVWWIYWDPDELSDLEVWNG